jgi:hypothetical protein
MGWFHPSAEGEALMPEVVVPLIGNYIRLSQQGSSASQPLTIEESARLGEYEKALDRVGALELELRRDDGSLIPTESVAIQDVEQLLECYEDDDETWMDDMEDAFDFDDDESEAWKRGGDDSVEDEGVRALQRDIEHDAKLISEWIEERSREHEWTPEDDEPLPRYQIWVLLSDPSAVP